MLCFLSGSGNARVEHLKNRPKVSLTAQHMQWIVDGAWVCRGTAAMDVHTSLGGGSKATSISTARAANIHLATLEAEVTFPSKGRRGLSRLFILRDAWKRPRTMHPVIDHGEFVGRRARSRTGVESAWIRDLFNCRNL